MQQEQIDYIAEKIVERIGEYVNSLDRRNLGVPMMDELAVMQMEMIVSETIKNPDDKDFEIPSYY